MNTISPIQQVNSIEELQNAAKTQKQDSGSAAIPFKSMFEDAVSNAQQTNAELNNEVYKLTTGQSDNVHNLMIASQKASLSVDLVVELRNKLLDAYKEVMSTSI